MKNNRRLVPLATVKAKPVEWLWRNWIPLGALTIVEGDHGQSKSTIMYDLSARVTSGQAMPLSHAPTIPAGVVLIQAEDNPGSVIKPALRAAGADVKRVRVYDQRRFAGPPLALPADLPIVEDAAAEVGARLVVIDPMDSFLDCDANNNRKVRKVLGALAAFAEQARLAVVIIRHLRQARGKNALYQGTGSIGIIGIARSALWVTNDPDSLEPYHHLLVQSKTNLSAAGAVRYRTIQRGKVIGVDWLGEADITPRELLAAANEDPTRLQQAVAFLQALLSHGGPWYAPDVYEHAKEADISRRTLERAKKILGVRSNLIHTHHRAFWTWSLPETAEGQGADVTRRTPPDDL